jgi:116 kDa U5 small nuclear ribonucleoprotein component
MVINFYTAKEAGPKYIQD